MSVTLISVVVFFFLIDVLISHNLPTRGGKKPLVIFQANFRAAFPPSPKGAEYNAGLMATFRDFSAVATSQRFEFMGG